MFEFNRKRMNKSCKFLLAQLCEEMRNSDIYAGLDISISASTEGAIRIHQEKYGVLVNNFDFYPDKDGWIDSIAIYGQDLDDHYRIIGNSLEIFGLRVSNIAHEGVYIDITIEPSQLNPYRTMA